MKKIIISIVVIGALVSGYILLSGNAETPVPTSGTTIVAFGDSLVVGVGSTPGNDFVSLVAAEVGEPIINFGQSGDTTADALLRIDDVLAEDPKVVLLLVGGNDYLRQVPKAQTFANLAEMIETIQATGAVVVLLGVRGGLLSDTYESDYRELATTYNTPYIPNVLDGLFGKPAFMSDTVHPNDAGYRVIADRVAPVLSELLSQ